MLVAVCEIVGVEMVFVMDESGSIGEENFQMMKEFAIEITKTFEIAPDRTQVGWISFDDTARVIFDLSAHGDSTSLHSAIRSAPYGEGLTNIGDGLILLSGMFSSRDAFDIPKVAIVVTDGQSNRGNTSEAVARLRKDINIFVVGVGDNVNEVELQLVASAGVTTDNLEHLYYIEGFIDEELDTLRETIKARACFGK